MKLSRKVIDINLKKDMTTNELCDQMFDAGGFVAKKVAMATKIFANMLTDKDCVKFLSFPACIVATGTRGVLKTLIQERMVDVVITTCGTLDHDLARTWGEYYHDDFFMDDIKLRKHKINRLGNILIPYRNYGSILEKNIQPILEEIYRERRTLSTKEIIWEFGNKIDDPDSLIYWSAKNMIPVYIPGIIDGAFGFQLWMFKQTHRDFNIDLFKDEDDLAEIVFKAKKTGAVVVGGGISKHHTIWWNQFRDGLNYAIYITTAEEYDGSLSGARVSEAISWNKVQTNAEYVTVEGDATVLLPLIVSAVMSKTIG